MHMRTIFHYIIACSVCLWAAAPTHAEPDYRVVYLTAQEDAPVATPALAPKAEKKNYDASLSIGYAVDASDHGIYAANMLVTELELARVFTPHHAFTLSALYGLTSENHDGLRWDSRSVRPFTDNYDRWTLSLLGGYRFTQPLGSRVSLQLGVKGGLDLQHLKVDYGRNYEAKEKHQFDGYNPLTGNKMHTPNDDCTLALGLAYAAYTNLHFNLHSTEEGSKISAFVGYAIWNSTARPRAYLSSGAHPIKQKADAILRHEIRVGLSITY